MDPIQILESVNAIYSNAFSQLITITVAMIAFGGVILPFIWQIIQNHTLHAEQKTIKSQISDEIKEAKENLRLELLNQVSKENEKTQKQITEKLDVIKNEIDEKFLIASAGTLFLQAQQMRKSGNFAQAAGDLSVCVVDCFKGKNETNGQRALRILIVDCLPNLFDSDFEEYNELDPSLDSLVKYLKENNSNGRFSDNISQINKIRSEAKKRKNPGLPMFIPDPIQK